MAAPALEWNYALAKACFLSRSSPSVSPRITVALLLTAKNDHEIESEDLINPRRAAHERAVVAFATVQLCALIYLQKFALFAPAFSLSVSMLIMLAGVAWLFVTGDLRFVTPRSAAMLLFLGFCFLSESLANGSWSSLTQLILLYIPMALSADISVAVYKRIMNRFILLMIVPAGIMLVQYAYQKLTSLSDPFNLENFFPKSILMPGFYYNAKYPWYSTFSRPNGFFFLEPSFASAFTASATILEISYFRRPWCTALLVAATVLSLGGTGVFMLAIAAPFLLVRESPRVVVVVAIMAVVALIVMLMLDIPLPMTNRLDELNDEHSSGGLRLLMPAEEFGRLLSHPSYYLAGDGAGSISPQEAGNPWPLVKVFREYGLIAMILFLAFYLVGIVEPSNLPLKVALSIVYFFTGGYLLSPALDGLIILLCFVLAPMKTESRSIADSGDAARQMWVARPRLRPVVAALIPGQDGTARNPPVQ
jgi:hypothetical protein